MSENEISHPTKIAVIGELDQMIGFMTVGFEVLDCSDVEGARQQLEKAAAECAIVFIDERFAEQMQSELEKYNAMPLPAVIPIPAGSASSGWSSRRLHRLVEKAVGSDIS